MLLHCNRRGFARFSVTLSLIPLGFCTMSLYDESLTVARSCSGGGATVIREMSCVRSRLLSSHLRALRIF